MIILPISKIRVESSRRITKKFKMAAILSHPVNGFVVSDLNGFVVRNLTNPHISILKAIGKITKKYKLAAIFGTSSRYAH